MSDRLKPYTFLLLPGHSQLGLACAVEALSLANRHIGGPYYRWTLVSEQGGQVAAYNGVEVSTQPLRDLARDETLIVCAGENASAGATPRVLGWLRAQMRNPRDLGALSSGSYVLARAGLLNGKTISTHWEYKPTLYELLPDVAIDDGLYSVDGRVFTCAGGAASMDMMLHRVRQDQGDDVAFWVADQMVYTAPRAGTAAQRMARRLRPEMRNSKLALALQVMEANMEEPLASGDIATIVQLSTRQLERLFAAQLGCSPKRHYLLMRLERARHLLQQTNMSATEIALACGFRTPSHFSKTYRKEYGTTPGRDSASPAQFW